jgi:anti-anti-sigma factor
VISVTAAVLETGAAMPRTEAVVAAPVEIDIATAREFEQAAMRALDASDGRIVIDQSATTFMDLSGARVLARATRRAGERGGTVSLASVGPEARRLLDLVAPAWTALLDAADDAVPEDPPVYVSAPPDGYPDTRRDLRVIGCAFDGSPESYAALRWAAGLARRVGARLETLTVLTEAALERGDTPDRMLAEQSDAALAAVGEAGDTNRVLSGDPAAELTKAGDGVDLLVLGSRGGGPVDAALLGSVSEAVARSAPCPVVVVPRGSAIPC